MNDGSLQFGGQRNQFVVRIGAARPSQDRHLARLVQFGGEPVKLFAARSHLGPGKGKVDAPLLGNHIGKRHIAGQNDHGNAPLGERGLYRNLKNARHLRWMRD